MTAIGFAPEALAGQLHAAEDVVILARSPHARAENVANALVNGLRSAGANPVAQDHGKRILPGGGGLDVRQLIANQWVAGDKPRIARAQFRPAPISGVIAACDCFEGGDTAAPAVQAIPDIGQVFAGIEQQDCLGE